MWWNYPIDDIGIELRKLNHCVDICNLPVGCTTQFRNACCGTWTVICLCSKFLMLINLTSAEAFFRHWTVSLIQWDLLELDPFFDSSGVVLVGGRVQSYPWERKIQFSIQAKKHIAKLLVLHFYEIIRHQGRHLTIGATRDKGYWITDCKTLVYSILSDWV